MNYQEYVEARKKIEAFEKEQGSQIPALVEMVMREVGLNAFVAVGYTPSFNDGDPCTYNFISSWALEYFEDYIEEMEDYPQTDVKSIAINMLDKLGDSADNKLSRFDDFEHIFQRDNEYGQAYFAYIDENDKFHFKKEDYDNGY